MRLSSNSMNLASSTKEVAVCRQMRSVPYQRLVQIIHVTPRIFLYIELHRAVLSQDDCKIIPGKHEEVPGIMVKRRDRPITGREKEAPWKRIGMQRSQKPSSVAQFLWYSDTCINQDRFMIEHTRKPSSSLSAICFSVYIDKGKSKREKGDHIKL